ncbi:MAG: prepilin peptidase [Gemmatimonadota bacterium]|jgi:leader peptidase (prepilin peptidase)/N-methyltransferase
MPDWMIWMFAFVLGTLIGSFLNVCIYRWPAELSVIRPRSRCPACSAAIAGYDNIPILSYLVLRGRCRHCGAPISIQYPVIELATGLIWLAAAIRFGVSVDAASSAIFLTLVLGIAMTDAKEMVIPDQFSLGGTVIGLGLAAIPGGMPLVDSIIGAAGAYLLFWLVKLGAEKLFRKPALGVGDIHMMAMVGAFLGIGGALLTILLGAVLGLVIGVPILMRRRGLQPLGSYMPLGTFLALGAAIAHGWGPVIIDWYLVRVLGVG